MQIQRPLDTLSQERLQLEAEAILEVLTLISMGSIDLVSSTVLALETQRNPMPMRREHGEQVLAQAEIVVRTNDEIQQRAAYFVNIGIKTMDALHLAAAESVDVDYSCTCDDRFLRAAKRINDLRIEIVSPLELAERMEL